MRVLKILKNVYEDDKDFASVKDKVKKRPSAATGETKK